MWAVVLAAVDSRTKSSTWACAVFVERGTGPLPLEAMFLPSTWASSLKMAVIRVYGCLYYGSSFNTGLHIDVPPFGNSSIGRDRFPPPKGLLQGPEYLPTLILLIPNTAIVS